MQASGDGTAPRRGQAQYIEHPVPDRSPEPIRIALAWAVTNLNQQLTIAALADPAHLSIRTFGRRFHKITGTTPHQWIIAQRLELARQLLETTDLPVDRVTRQAGFRSPLSLRQHFHNRLGTNPSAYRRAFTHSAEPSNTTPGW